MYIPTYKLKRFFSLFCREGTFTRGISTHVLVCSSTMRVNVSCCFYCLPGRREEHNLPVEFFEGLLFRNKNWCCWSQQLQIADTFVVLCKWPFKGQRVDSLLPYTSVDTHCTYGLQVPATTYYKLQNACQRSG